jgi:hypothetical protein
VKSVRCFSFLLALVAACSGKSPDGDSRDNAAPVVDESCRAYLDAYGACFRRMTPQSPAIADARAENARAALLRIGDPQELHKTCTAGLAQLRASCR